MSRVVHKTPDAAAQGPMVVNPGGPGGAGLSFALIGDFVPDGAGDAYDWIGFDPRGVGASEPSLSCVPDFDGYHRPRYVPITRSVEQAWLDRTETYTEACAADGGRLLDHLTTVDSAMDLESIRRALGVERINYYGFSYGTYLGQVYATLFPDRFRRVIFDGNVDPTRVWARANTDQNIAFERSVTAYFDWIARYDEVYHLGDTAQAVERRYYRELAHLTRAPAGGIIGPAEWADIFVQAAYYVYGWEDVAAAFAGWVHDSAWEPLRDLFGSPPFDDNTHAVYLGVVCTDAPWPDDYHRYRFATWRTFVRAPFLTWGNAWFNAPCLDWPAKSGQPVQVDGRGVESALLVNETLDAATPFRGALEVRKRFPTSVLVEGVGGTTHSGSLSGVECVDSIIVAYLRSGALPDRVPGNRSDTRCDPVPQPVPEGATERRATSDDRVTDARKDLAGVMMTR